MHLCNWGYGTVTHRLEVQCSHHRARTEREHHPRSPGYQERLLLLGVRGSSVPWSYLIKLSPPTEGEGS